MSGKTSIEWADQVWNPVTGCSKVSEGCRHCYAETIANRFWKGRKFTDVQCHPERLGEPLHWRKPRRVFVNSMSDLFHEDVPDEFIDRVFAVMALAENHTFQILTKRPVRMLAYLGWMGPFASTREDVICEVGSQIGKIVWDSRGNKRENYALVAGIRKLSVENRRPWVGWPLPNVWLGVSVENQKTADERIPLLLQCPAAVHFVSYEPALEAVDFDPWLTRDGKFGTTQWDGIDWVIVGGESGPNARPCNIEWIYSVIEQCGAAGVPCFVKQLGSQARYYVPALGRHQFPELKDRKGGDMAEWPEDLRVRELPIF